jgi:hypothetical protein
LEAIHPYFEFMKITFKLEQYKREYGAHGQGEYWDWKTPFKGRDHGGDVQ